MTNNSANVRIGITGELYNAVTGTARPTTAVSALNAAYGGNGYISEDGVTETPDETVERIPAWGGYIVRSTTTEATVTLQMTLIETKVSVLELYHKGSTVEEVSTGQFKIDVRIPTEVRQQFVLDVLDGTKHLRFDVGDGEVTERGEIVYATAEAIAYNITITCYPDADGVFYTKFSDDPSWDPSP